MSYFNITFKDFGFQALNFQDFKAKEKNSELSKRQKLLGSSPIDISTSFYLNDLKKDVNLRDFNNKWAYRPVELTGKFDYSKELAVKTHKNGVIGYTLICPFQFVSTENPTEFNTIFVNRGFVDSVIYDRHKGIWKHNSPGYTTIRGVVSKVHHTKHDKDNDYHDIGTINTINLDEFAKFNFVKNLVSKDVLLNEVNFDSTNFNIFPSSLDISSLTSFKVSDECHTSLKRFYSLLSFGVVFSNMYLWVCL